jgi:hypothetical protein
VPWLTISASAPGSQTYLNDFTSDTVPTGTEAARHITDAATTVGAGLGTLTTALEPLATLSSSLLAAYTLAAAYARSDDDRDRAAALYSRYELAASSLATAAENSGASTTDALPVAYVPDPVPWGDSLLVDQVGPYPWSGTRRIYID